MGVTAVIKQYLASSGTDSASKSRDVIRYAALGVTAGYALSLTYRVGGFKYLMPAKAYNSLVAGVERLKEGTQPLVDKERFGKCSAHLIKTYSALTVGWVLSALGTRAFFALPDMPIGVPIAVSATCATTLVFARKWMTPTGRMAAYTAMCFATGVSFGPLNWVAFDSVVPFAIVVGSTAVGFCAPLYITRGIVSYFCSAQLLSCSLSVVGAGLVVASAKASATTSADSRRRIEQDVSSMVTFQIIANLAMGALHTVPTIYRFMKESPKELELEDPIYQASLIYGAFAYTLWTFFRIISTRIMRFGRKGKDGKRVGEELKDAMGGFSPTEAPAKSATLFTVSNMSNLSASLMFLFTYVRIVTYMQNNKHGSTKAFDLSRRIFGTFSPIQ